MVVSTAGSVHADVVGILAVLYYHGHVVPEPGRPKVSRVTQLPTSSTRGWVLRTQKSRSRKKAVTVY